MNRSELINLPVITLDDGSFVGQIKDLIIEPNEKMIIGFEIGSKRLFQAKHKYIYLGDIETIGSYAVTIATKNVIFTEEQKATRQFKNYNSPLGKRIITRSGSFAGRVVDFSFDLHSGILDKLYIKNEEYDIESLSLSSNSILTLGKDVIVTDIEPPLKSTTNETNDKYSDETHDSHSDNTKTGQGQFSKKFGSSKFSSTLEEKAVDFAIGRQVFRTVKDSHGGVIINRGEIIKPEVIDLAREKNRLAHLLVAAGVSEIIEGLDYTWEKIDEGSRKLIENLNQIKKELKTQDKPQDFFTHIIDLDDTLYKLWNERLKRTFANMDFDYNTAASIKQFLLNKTPAFRVTNEKGEVLKEKNDAITKDNLEVLYRPEDLIALLAAVSAKEVTDFIQNIESNIMDQIKREKPEKNEIMN
ncbi:PRC-barrel domain-containing protein [Natranaerofaba carboxydovora]|uniref:PRC-barrel domain-containing protein n=1 Tax=Natranaerofaba carboxydovora TaxID=2742683 RepID=UPI001F12AACA|nr:PRC-barrel domain-containing protein [Natranaerofaba carboxydovora]UMZ74855.1 PRC-barrel domain protein [Natranaerofaba carboxydovora]